MSCRSTPGSSAATSLARFASGLSDHEIGAVFHKLRRDAAGTPDPPAADVTAWLRAQEDAVAGDTNLGMRRKESVLDRLRAAQADADRGRLPDGPTFAAWQAIGLEANRLATPRPSGSLPFARGGTLWLSGDRNGPYEEEIIPTKITSARKLVCPCCYGYLRVVPDDPFLEPFDIDWDDILEHRP
jgi:hypothetical protein